MNKDKAQKVLEYLEEHNMGFCFLGGAIVSREDCMDVIHGTTSHTGHKAITGECLHV